MDYTLRRKTVKTVYDKEKVLYQVFDEYNIRVSGVWGYDIKEAEYEAKMAGYTNLVAII